MITLYHVSKTLEAYEAIRRTNIILPGRNARTNRVEWAHFSRDSFNWVEIDLIGPDTNKAWIVEVEVPDSTVLKPDPAIDEGISKVRWVIHEGSLAVNIRYAWHIANVRVWGNDRPEIKVRLFA